MTFFEVFFGIFLLKFRPYANITVDEVLLLCKAVLFKLFSSRPTLHRQIFSRPLGTKIKISFYFSPVSANKIMHPIDWKH